MPAERPALRGRAKEAALRASARLRLDAAARRLARWRGSDIRVMVLHGTPVRHADAFAAQLRWVAGRFALLDPQEYLAVLDGTVAPPARQAIVFTFDDGLASNAEVAAPLLERHGTRGLFFVCPAFASTAGAEAREFFAGHVRTADDPARMSAEDYAPMTPAILRDLRARGHVIGNHTDSHQDLGRASPALLPTEIDGARATLAGWLGEDVSCFAWTFAWDAITAPAWAAVLARHRYCFTACPGPGALGPGCVWRTNVEADLPAHAYPFFYSGLVDPIWWRRRRRLTALHRAATDQR